jgi:hypothetical protein
LTFANKVEDPDEEDDSEYFKIQLQNWKKQFKDHFAAVGINSEVCIPVIPVGNKTKMRLPDREDWLSDLWIECYQVMKSSSRLGMYQINENSLMNVQQQDSPSVLKLTWEAITACAIV